MFSSACAADLNGTNDLSLMILPNRCKSVTDFWTSGSSCPISSDSRRSKSAYPEAHSNSRKSVVYIPQERRPPSPRLMRTDGARR